MSILRVDEIRDNAAGFNDVVKFANNGGTENGTLCRTWVNFNGQGAVAIRANFNVNSITDNGTGDYTVNYSNALSDANYSFQGTASQAGTGNNGQIVSILGSTAPTTTSTQFRTQQDNVGVTDSAYVCLSVFR